MKEDHNVSQMIEKKKKINDREFTEKGLDFYQIYNKNKIKTSC